MGIKLVAIYYDDVEVDRVVRADLDPKVTHAMLSAAITPVADRLLKSFKAAQAAEHAAKAQGNEKEAAAAKDMQEALILFRSNMGAFLRLYAFLSQIFDYGATQIEARNIFYRRLIPLLDFGREKDGIDLSKVVLSHHKLSTKGPVALALTGDTEKLKPMSETGSASVQEKEKVLLSQIVQKLNDLFTGDLTDEDQLSYAISVKGKLLTNRTLVNQAASNQKEQFGNSPALTKAITDAIIEAFETHAAMSKQALESDVVRAGLKDALMGPGQLYEELRSKVA